MLKNGMKLVEIKKSYISLSDGYHDMYLFNLKKEGENMEQNKEIFEEVTEMVEYENISDDDLELLVKKILVRYYGAFKELAK